jgi:hypothetical protein
MRTKFGADCRLGTFNRLYRVSDSMTQRVGWSDVAGPARLIPTRGALFRTRRLAESLAEVLPRRLRVFLGAFSSRLPSWVDAAELGNAGFVLSRPCRTGVVVFEARQAGLAVLRLLFQLLSFWFPSSAWEPTHAKLRFAGRKRSFVHAAPKRSLGARWHAVLIGYFSSFRRIFLNSTHIGLPAWSWRARMPSVRAAGSLSVKSRMSRLFM